MPKRDFNKVAKNCFSVSLLHIFRTPFPKKTSKGLLLHVYNKLSSISTSHRKYKLQIAGWDNQPYQSAIVICACLILYLC